jgi:hypothetical protein
MLRRIMKHKIIEVNHKSSDKIPYLMRLVYGESFSQTVLYNPIEINDLIDNKEAIFFLAVDAEEIPKALLGLRFYHNPKTSAEFIPFVTDPTIRGIESGFIIKDLISAFVAKLNHLHVELHTLYALATTDHNLIFDLCKYIRFTLTGIFFEWTAVKSCLPDFKQLKLEPSLKNFRKVVLEHRRADLLYVRIIPKFIRPYKVLLPKQFSPLLKNIYNEIKLPVTYATMLDNDNTCTSFTVKRNVEGSRTQIELDTIAKDAAEQIQATIVQEIDNEISAIHIYIPLTQTDITDLVTELLDFGCFYCGLLPFHKGKDVLILQYLNCLPGPVPKSFLNNALAKQILSCLPGHIRKLYQ